MIQARVFSRGCIAPVFASCLCFLQARRRDGAAMVREFLPYLLRRAKFLGSRFSYVPGLCPDDLLSAGMEGVLSACDAYSGDLLVPFDVFVKLRVRWSMLNEVRRLDPVTRSSREFRRHLDRVVWKLEQSLGRPCNLEEIAEVLGKDIQDVHAELIGQMRGTPRFVEPVADAQEMDGGQLEPQLESPDCVEQSVLAKEVWERARHILSGAPPVWWQVLHMYYAEGMTLCDIGKSLRVSKQRVSQIKDRALREVQQKLKITPKDGGDGRVEV